MTDREARTARIAASARGGAGKEAAPFAYRQEGRSHPKGVTTQLTGPDYREGPKGEISRWVHAELAVGGGRTISCGGPSDEPAQGAPRTHPHARPNMVDGSPRVREGARDSRGGLQRNEAVRVQLVVGSPSVPYHAPQGHQDLVREHVLVRSKAWTRSSWARSPRRSRIRPPEPYKGKGIATRVSRSGEGRQDRPAAK